MDLRRVRLSQRAAEHAEVLRVGEHPAPVHGARPGHYAVRVRRRRLPPEQVQFGEGVLVEQAPEPFPRRELALGMLALGRELVATDRRLASLAQAAGVLMRGPARPGGRARHGAERYLLGRGHARRTSTGRPPRTRSDSMASGNGSAPGASSNRNLRATIAATSVASIIPRWLPTQTRGPAPNGMYA